MKKPFDILSGYNTFSDMNDESQAIQQEGRECEISRETGFQPSECGESQEGFGCKAQIGIWPDPRLIVPPRADGKARKGPVLLPDILRCLAKVDNREEIPNECWLWTGQHNWAGYSIFTLMKPNGRWGSMVAHRWLYEDYFGPVDKSLDLDHLCRNRGCVNPFHLEPVTRRINLLRGQTQTARNAARTHCPHGHAYDEENTRITQRGTRACIACEKIDSKARWVKIKASR